MKTPTEAITTNPKLGIKTPMIQGRPLWVAPVLIVLARPLFSLMAQMFTTVILRIKGIPDPALAATQWWTVHGTLVDLSCLALLIWLVRNEGIKLFDLISFDKKKIWTDVLLGLGIFIVVFPIAIMGGSTISSFIVYGTFQPQLPEGALIRTLPLWGVLYSRIVWWVIWSFTEELTYQGYALPRLKLLYGQTWLCILWVGFGWALQHSFLPLLFDLRHFIWIFITFFPLTIIMQLLYLRFRRLTPLIISHWGMDFLSVLLLVQPK